MKQIGLSPSETAIIYGTMPFLGAFVRTFVGALADKLQKHQVILMMCCLLTGVFHGCLLLVPSRSTDLAPKVYLQCNLDPNDTKIILHDSECLNATISTCEICCVLQDVVCLSNPGKDCQYIYNQPPCTHFTIKNISKAYMCDSIGNQTCSAYTFHSFIHNDLAYEDFSCSDAHTLDCHMSCEATNSHDCLAPSYTEMDKKFDSTFWIFFWVCLIGQMFFAPVFSLIDAITYDYLGNDFGKWGHQRLWGTVGYGVFAVISGLIMDIFAKGPNGEKNYLFAFVAYAILNILASISVYTYKISREISSPNIFNKIGQLLKSIEIVMLLVEMTVFGIYTGLIETFLYWHLSTLGGSQLLNGLCMGVNLFPEILMLLFAGKVIKKIGHLNCLHLSALAFGIRFLAYSLIQNPWFVLLVEPLQSVCFGLMYAAASSYASMLTPPGLSGTIQGLIGALYFGAGECNLTPRLELDDNCGNEYC